MMRELVMRVEEWPHGFRCIDCCLPILPGQHYSKRLVGFHGDDPVLELICEPCALAEDEA